MLDLFVFLPNGTKGGVTSLEKSLSHFIRKINHVINQLVTSLEKNILYPLFEVIGMKSIFEMSKLERLYLS